MVFPAPLYLTSLVIKKQVTYKDKMIVITNEYLCLKCYLNFCEIVLDEIGSF